MSESSYLQIAAMTDTAIETPAVTRSSKTLPALLAVLLVAVVIGVPLYLTSDYALIREAQQQVSSKLRDPGSAQFRNMRVVQDADVVCGEVNGKNGFGAYSGFSPFAAKNYKVISKWIIEFKEENDTPGFFYREYCSEKE